MLNDPRSDAISRDQISCPLQVLLRTSALAAISNQYARDRMLVQSRITSEGPSEFLAQGVDMIAMRPQDFM